jgi:hypothetical protein
MEALQKGMGNCKPRDGHRGTVWEVLYLRHTFKTWLGKNQGACVNQVPSIPPKHVIESAP